MRLLGGFGIGRWFGFEIRIDYSWFLIFFLVVWTFSEQVFPGAAGGYGTAAYYAMGVVFALILFLSVLLHELSHSVVARTRGIEVEGITLFVFGGVARTRMEAETAADEFLLTAAGPLSSLALGGLFYGLGLALGAAAAPRAVLTVAEHLALVNVVLAIFNMIPGFPLDGGRIFRSAVWHFSGDLGKATRWATRAGQGFGYLLIAYGAFLFWQGFMLNGLWAAFIGWFLSSAAASSFSQFRARRVLAGVRAGEVMSREPRAVSPDLSLLELVEEYFLRRRHSVYPVARDRQLMGLVTVEDASSVPRERWPETRVSEVMQAADEAPTVGPDETLDAILNRLAGSEDSQVLVVEGDELVGILSLDDIGGWLERARTLGLEEGRP